jgi:hypothetical protein
VPSAANYFLGIKTLLSNIANTPGTKLPVVSCNSFGFSGTTVDSPSAWSGPSGYEQQLAAAGGIAQSASDTYGTWFSTTANRMQYAFQAYYGIANPVDTGSTPLPTPTQPNLIGKVPLVAQVQPSDYGKNLPPGTGARTAGAVNSIISAAQGLSANYRFWWSVDSTYSASSWGSYIEPTFTSGTPVSTLLPTGMMYGVPINSITGATSSSLTVNWTPVTGAGTGITYILYRNGAAVQTGLSSGTYTDTGLASNTTYLYTISMANANGTGPQGIAFSGTTTPNYLLDPNGNILYDPNGNALVAPNP